MKRILIMLALLLPLIGYAQIDVTQLRVNRLAVPMGVSPEEKPVLSWIASTPVAGSMQTAYEVTVTSSGKKVWSTGKVASDNSTAVVYEGTLTPDTRYEWSVRVWDNNGKVSKRVTSFWHTGLRAEDWKAKWVGEENEVPVPIHLRTDAALVAKNVRRATAYVSAHGIYEAYINGQRVGDKQLTPGWTSYNKHIQYQAFDVTKLLARGANTIAAIVTPGWYSGGINYGKVEKRHYYGKNVALLMQINIEYTDGTRATICTDDKWLIASKEAKHSGVTFATIYDGETVDARLRDAAWTTRSYDASAWKAVAVLDGYSYENIIPTLNESVIINEPIKPVKYIVTPKGEKVIDFGQNIVGWERVRLQGKAGDVVRIKHAEVLDDKGNFYTINLRKAKATSTYILSGGEDYFEPRHTFYGFRYIMVEGVEGDLNLEDFEIVPVWSGFDNIGTFTSSNATINQLQSNIWWGFHDNFVDVPTDCPQRDERLGWTGDAQVFFRTASFLGRVDTFFRKYLADLAADQRPDGGVPRVIPDTFPNDQNRVGAVGWADAATIIPWDHYMAYGDKSILAVQYKSMKAWVDLVIKKSEPRGWLWNDDFARHYGDWLFWTKDNDRDGQAAVTNKFLICQCFFANSVDIMARAARLLNRAEDAVYYEGVAAKVREAYMNEYVTPNGLISSDTQTAYVLALHFNMLPEHLRQQAVNRLVDNIRRYKNHITTGFLGTPYICNVLTDYGRSDVAYELLLQKTCPSWIYPISMGATTIWERWDSIRPGGKIPNNGMNSFNHYSYGAIGDWLYRSAVGIRETSPGYKTIAIRPHTGGDFSNMSAATQTPYGRVSAAWMADNNTLTQLEVEIPFNTTATVYVPAASAEAVTCSNASIAPHGFVDGYVEYHVGSGKYTFTVK
ncbi:MAG: family 78 glycoside hydrolase catalytic domain [Alistipes sp.]|nr:family 78 glycoside hydrolase catalytic domain [Alistipes sp.]